MTVEDIFKLIVDWLSTTGTMLARESFRVTVRQVYAEAFGYMIVTVMLIFVTICLFYFRNKSKKEYEEICKLVEGKKSYDVTWTEERRYKDSEEYTGIYTGFGIGAIVASLLSSIPWVMRFINPEWYAIKMLIDLVTG